MHVCHVGRGDAIRWAHVMGLECLLVTCDSTLLGQIKSAFHTQAASLDLRQDSAGISDTR